MMLGVSTNNFDGDTLIQKYRNIAKHGFRYVNTQLDEDYSIEDITASINTFKQLNLYSGQISSSLTPSVFNNIVQANNAIEFGKNLCDIQKLFGGKQISINPGVFTKDKKDSIRYSTRVLQEICDYASKQDIIVALAVKTSENQLVNSWSDIRKYFAKIDRENLMLNLDTKFIADTKPDNRALSPFSESIAQFQIKDYCFDLDINNENEVTLDIAKWADKILPLVKDSMKECRDTPLAVLSFNDTKSREVRYALDYLAAVLPELAL